MKSKRKVEIIDVMISLDCSLSCMCSTFSLMMTGLRVGVGLGRRITIDCFGLSDCQ
jgi:hypothetical protein